MRVLPILFNTNMVRAILDNRKTVTRRVVKDPYFVDDNGYCVVTMRMAPRSSNLYYQIGSMPYQENPYRICDTLYVRETWRVGAWDIQNQMIAFDYRDGTCGQLTYISDRELFERLVNQSREDARKEKCEYNGADFVWKKGNSPCRWRPSIHMPKEAARIWLMVKDVKVERLCDMKLDDFLSEGVCIRPEAFNDPENAYMQARNEFVEIWDSTIPKDQKDIYGWEANPWVWIIEFERCEKPESEE